MADSSAVPAPAGGRRFGLAVGSDARLARRAAAGDERAFAAIYERYHQELYRYCRAILNSPEDAQDALQGTMASALRALPGETRTIALRPWLYRVARNEALTILRRRQPTAEAEESLLPAQPSAHAAAETRERLRLLVADLSALPERQRSALVMRELSGLSYEQIAAALEVSGGAARQVVYEARVALQELEEGRAMECDRVRRAISERDGRVLRGRKIRAHLRGCESCSDFRRALETRSADLELVAPPLSAVAAAGVLSGVLGGASKGGAIGSLLTGGFTGGGALTAKAVGVIAASAAIGAGAGVATGVDLPLVGGDADEPAATRSAPAVPGEPSHEASGGNSRAGAHRAQGVSGPDAAAGNDRRNDAAAAAEGRGPTEETGQPDEPASQGAAIAPAESAAGGASAVVPAGGGQPESPPGGGVAAERSSGKSAAGTVVTGPPEHAQDAGQRADLSRPEK